MCLLSTIIFLFLGSSLFTPSSSSEPSVCEYAECKETAAEILSNLNEKVDPCHDFYEYSCGGRGMNIMSLSKIEAEITKRLASDLYADDNLRNHGSKAIREVKKVYDDCVKRGEGSCNSLAREKCEFAFVRVYMDKYFPVAEHRAAQRLVSSVRRTFLLDIIHRNTWMDPLTKKIVLRNLRELQLDVGYPDWLVDNRELDLECQGVEHDSWALDPLDANARFAEHENNRHIIIAAGVLHGSIFSRKVPNYMNYGGAGYIAGHEISHAIYLWTQETTPSSGRDSELQCVVDQLETIPLPNDSPSSNGRMFLNEMVADIASLNVSLTAYRELQRKVEEQKMPGLTHFSNEQLFFLAQATTWCSNPNLLFAPSEWPTWGDHPEAYHRIVIPAMNSPDFAKAFNCPVGSPMNPVKKCRLW